MSNSPLEDELGEWFNDPFADDIPASQDGSQTTHQKVKKRPTSEENKLKKTQLEEVNV